MTEADINHFLLISDPGKPEPEVRELGSDYDAAIVAYNEAEENHRGDEIEVVLLSADSVETIRRTHSSYFTAHTVDPIDTVLAAAAD
ncbi:MAG: hypothetical protein HYX29_07300 [Solirubrobacterales bacterium]|nr:hypothetical protein [Solirubrobacterales bacterium]